MDRGVCRVRAACIVAVVVCAWLVAAAYPGGSRAQGGASGQVNSQIVASFSAFRRSRTEADALPASLSSVKFCDVTSGLDNYAECWVGPGGESPGSTSQPADAADGWRLRIYGRVHALQVDDSRRVPLFNGLGAIWLIPSRRLLCAFIDGSRWRRYEFRMACGPIGKILRHPPLAFPGYGFPLLAHGIEQIDHEFVIDAEPDEVTRALIAYPGGTEPAFVRGGALVACVGRGPNWLKQTTARGVHVRPIDVGASGSFRPASCPALGQGTSSSTAYQQPRPPALCSRRGQTIGSHCMDHHRPLTTQSVAYERAYDAVADRFGARAPGRDIWRRGYGPRGLPTTDAEIAASLAILRRMLVLPIHYFLPAPRPRPLIATISPRSLITIGPAMPTGAHQATRCAALAPGAGTPRDCAYVNSVLPKRRLVRIPAAGTITRWRVEGFNGRARLLILTRGSGTSYKVVAKSRAQTKPCVMEGGFCGPAFARVYTFATHLTVKPGDLIGIELISRPGCGDQAADACSDIGATRTNQLPTYFGSAPPLGRSATPNQNALDPQGDLEEILLNADLRIRAH